MRGHAPGWEKLLFPGKSQSLTSGALKTDLFKSSFYPGQNQPREGESLVSCHTAAESQPQGFLNPPRPEGPAPRLGEGMPNLSTGPQLLDPAAVFHVNSVSGKRGPKHALQTTMSIGLGAAGEEN